MAIGQTFIFPVTVKTCANTAWIVRSVSCIALEETGRYSDGYGGRASRKYTILPPPQVESTIAILSHDRVGIGPLSKVVSGIALAHEDLAAEMGARAEGGSGPGVETEPLPTDDVRATAMGVSEPG